MIITRDDFAAKIGAYLRRDWSLDELVDWAEQAMLDSEFQVEDAANLSEVVARLGVADVRAFELTWDDCEELLARLGYQDRIEISAV